MTGVGHEPYQTAAGAAYNQVPHPSSNLDPSDGATHVIKHVPAVSKLYAWAVSGCQ